ncbi:hypothetical protein GCM10023321_77430 [Pseudonocardia eucalypti]|uniref:CopG family transcriptional regulator n=1 Tax=Pseudonocardia eucalypti TaxID=648755 RepID=A0ABP9RAZ7_9PSEU|nr:cytosine/adenosine deaminase-related metal-dependent hydrolase [Pseudonocardia eucalypti]
MAAKKVTITLPEQLAERLAQRAREAGIPFSTWIAQAAEERARIEDGQAAMAEWTRDEGPLTDDELAEAAAELARADVLAQRAARRLAG